jgi:hypothetical protein
MIAETLCCGDLYNLTHVCRNMAAIGCPQYLRRNRVTLSASRFYLTVCGEGFKVLPVWHCSPEFSALPMLFCIFDFTDVICVVSQMRELRKYIKSFLSWSRPIFDHIFLNDFETVKLQNGLELLQTTCETGCRTITMSWLGSGDSRTVGTKELAYRILLESLQELTLEYFSLSPLQWMNFLSKLHIPSLHQLTIAGGMSIEAVYHFLRWHPGICVLHMQGTGNDVPPPLGRLRLPLLRSLRGSLSQILHLLKSFSSTPALENLAIGSDSPTSLQNGLLDEVISCLMMSEGSLSLEIKLLSNESSVAKMTRANICAPAAQVLALPCTVRSLYIEYEDVCDESVLVRDFSIIKIVNMLIFGCQAYCKAVMTLLPLHHIKLGKAELHRKGLK